MRSIEDINESLREHQSELEEKYKVKKIGVFGSYARGDQRISSDVDILVEFSEPIGWEFIDLKEFLESILGINVDLVTVGALKSQMKDSILQEVVYI